MSVRQGSVGTTRKMIDEAMLARLRIASGLVLFVYIVTHFIAHAAGLISLEAMAAMGKTLKPLWRTWPTTILLYGALAIHMFTVFWKLYTRRKLNMSWKEWLQLTLGIAIPVCMVVHVVGTRWASFAYGINDTYAYVLISTMVLSPTYAILNSIGLAATWLHACMGLHMWLRTKRSYKTWHYETGLVLAAILPTASLAGYWVAGERIAPLALDGEYMEAYYQGLNLSRDSVWTELDKDIYVARSLLLANLGLLVVFRAGHWFYRRRSAEVTVTYGDGVATRQPVGMSLLEMSKSAGVPHASICGGKGRCSTCRVRVLESNAKMAKPSDIERKVLTRVRAPKDVRLACQFYPRGDVKVVPLLPVDGTIHSANSVSPFTTGREKTVTIMFADLRDFTQTAEQRLPYDVVYLINQFSQSMGEVVENNGGRIDKFLGDGFMALFGLETSIERGAQDAVAAIGAMVAALERMNQRLEGDLDRPLRIGIGVHTGTVVLGDMGYGHARGLTALGDPVNIASRLEQETKEQKKIICISTHTLGLANMKASRQTIKTIAVRGREGKIRIHAINDINTLTPMTRG